MLLSISLSVSTSMKSWFQSKYGMQFKKASALKRFREYGPNWTKVSCWTQKQTIWAILGPHLALTFNPFYHSFITNIILASRQKKMQFLKNQETYLDCLTVITMREMWNFVRQECPFSTRRCFGYLVIYKVYWASWES